MRAFRGSLFGCLLFGVIPTYAIYAPSAEACTTFCLTDGKRHLIGKSYDWDIEHGMVFSNPKGLEKRALVLNPKDTPATWTSKHASLTFNQYGREFPNGGMNDAGLVVEVMWLDDTEAPPPDARPVVTELQWIQLQLDTQASVAEMVAAADGVRVSVVRGKVHYLACDKMGACAAFENVGGRMVVTTGQKLKSKVLTNHTYAASVAALGEHRGFGGSKAVPGDAGSLSRFVRASSLIAKAARKLASGSPTDSALRILDSVRSGDYTKWNIVYDPSALEVSFRTLSHPALKKVRFTPLIASCQAGAKMLDMATTEQGDVTGRFAAYAPEANRKLLESSLEPIAASLPPGATRLLAGYPSGMSCQAR
jgi:choloylglycine hydrolase